MDNLNPVDETARLAALAACAVMDTSRESSFDNIVFTVAQLFRVTMAALALVDADRVWVKASVGYILAEYPRASSMYSQIITSDDLTIVEDVSADARFASMSFATPEQQIRFLAAAPIRGPGGYNIGALCVFDRLPRGIADRQRIHLKQLAAEASELLRLRVPNLDLDMAG